MKIAFLSHLDLNLYLFRLPIMKELVKRNNEVFAICPRGEVFDKFKEYGIKAVEYKIDRGSLNVFKEIKTIQNIKEVVSKINPDILHSFMHKPNIYANLINHKNTINTITGLGSFFIHNDLKSKIVRNIIEYGYKISTKNTKKVIFQNNDDLNYFVSKKIIPLEKVKLIKSSGIDTDEWKIENVKCNIESLGVKIDKNKPIVLMIARVIKDKGVEDYIRAAQILKDKANFLYVGEIDRGNKNSFLPDWKNVIYLGFRRDIKELIAISDIFVLPSYREGVPRTLLEAGALKRAIVTTNTAGCRDVVDDNINGFLVPVKDYKILAKKIEILIENKALREKFGEEIREKVEKEFSIKKVVNEYLKVYEEILSV